MDFDKTDTKWALNGPTSHRPVVSTVTNTRRLARFLALVAIAASAGGLALLALLNFAPPPLAGGSAAHGSGPRAPCPRALRNSVDALRAEWDVPGVAAAVVMRGQTVFAEGFGVKRLVPRKGAGAAGAAEAHDARVTPHTLFQIGSTSKAFTALLAGIAVDDGLLAWSDKLSDRCAALQLPDPIAQAHANLFDALAHRTGLARHDFLMFAHDNFGPILDGMASLPQTLEFREQFQYNNLLFGVVGEVLLNATGRSWDQLLRERILDPLGMAETVSPLTASAGLPDVSRGFTLRNTEFPENVTFALQSVPPAGSIVSSVSDLTRWLSFMTNGGSLRNGTRLVSKDTFETLVSPKISVGAKTWDSWNPSYALGWQLDTYRGKSRVWHNGGTFGFSTFLATFPDEDLGVVVIANKLNTPAAQVIGNTLVDKVLFPYNPVPWSKIRREIQRKDEAAAAEAARELLARRNTSHPPTLSPANYTGVYSHPAFGRFVVRLPTTPPDEEVGAASPTAGATLVGSMDLSAWLGSHFDLTLAHWYGDVFGVYFPPDADWTSAGTDRAPDLLLEFHVVADGGVAPVALEFSLPPSPEPIRFKRAGDVPVLGVIEDAEPSVLSATVATDVVEALRAMFVEGAKGDQSLWIG
ncbi:hypothetical protein HK405_006975 [Cladochytrium tenue]|nr:hypothetical protein HK405_006975 [Cladochytrium tenue]